MRLNWVPHHQHSPNLLPSLFDYSQAVNIDSAVDPIAQAVRNNPLDVAPVVAVAADHSSDTASSVD